ncbi:MAG: DnaT-like ssDNA-binding protein [Fuscovulum sp.]|nr:MAG: DnaT-like ssDNA-binding protein [Fuscovulum sp.]
MTYGTLAAADAYHAQRGNAAWAAASSTDREAALLRASDWLDGYYIHRWPGSPAAGGDQTRAWPRVEAIDRYGNTLTGIPARVERAAYEAALFEVLTPRSLAPRVVQSETKVLTKVGSIQWTPMGKGELAESLPFLASVENILAPIIEDERGEPALLVV